MKGNGSIAREEDLFVFRTDTVQTRTVKSSAFQCLSAYSKGLIENPPEINTKVHFHFNGSDEGPQSTATDVKWLRRSTGF